MHSDRSLSVSRPTSLVPSSSNQKMDAALQGQSASPDKSVAEVKPAKREAPNSLVKKNIELLFASSLHLASNANKRTARKFFNHVEIR